MMYSLIYNICRVTVKTPTRNILSKHIKYQRNVEHYYTTKYLTSTTIPIRNYNSNSSLPKAENTYSYNQSDDTFSNSSAFNKALIAIIAGGFISSEIYRRSNLSLKAQEVQQKKRIIYEPTRKVKNDPANQTGLKLTLYQYESCPFCCKVRSMLNYYGIEYDVIEVDTLGRTQLKWSSYRKVPLLVLEGAGPNGYMELGDSTMSLSLLETYLRDPSQNIERVISFYPTIETKDKNGKVSFEFPNKYFVMHGEKSIDVKESKSNNDERKWRMWNDDVLIHVISPNLYRTVDEARSSIEQFAKSGNWEEINEPRQYWFIMKLGPYAMWLLGKKLKSKYNLKSEVRHSLYEACNQWTAALGDKKYMGGDTPNLADISVYGTLFCMEGCEAFKDMRENTKIMKWYSRMQTAVNNKEGARRISIA